MRNTWTSEGGLRIFAALIERRIMPLEPEEKSSPTGRRIAGPHWTLRWRRWLRPFLSRRGAPEDIALGAAIGIGVAFTPTIGMQMLLAYFIATWLKASRAAAVIPVWITMPVTIPPIYAFTYTVGRWFVDGPSVNQVRRQLIQMVRRLDGYDTFDLPARFRLAMEIGNDIFVPMWIGGLLVGTASAAVAYPVILWGVRRLRAFRERKKAHRSKRLRFSKTAFTEE